MKNLKKQLGLVAAFATTLSISHAQTPTSPSQSPTAQAKSPEQQASLRARYLAKELGLNADQQARLEPILLAQHQDVLALRSRKQAGGPRQGLGQEMKAAQAKYKEQIRAVLSPEQYAKFEQLRDEQRENLRQRRASGQVPAKMAE